ncbi:MAG: xanthine dehydrogenase accessory protein XdhC [Hyphomicrobiales bacterium]|nr:xanthine dehydrogenase accessory protein XdhC [Hyphomicrobiales bacterium]MBV8824474.1 xanthine dehydrogenase accessory protein XdhC [Hyphomicrobiales bacterium]
MPPVWPTIEQSIAAHGAAALVTLADVRGSSPRERGARMVVRPDGSFTGTIGGGTLEWMALAEAQALLARPQAGSVRRLKKSLGPDLGQCCGGRVTVLIERFGAEDRDAVAALAAAESAGLLVTVTAGEGERLMRRQAAAGDRIPERSGAYLRLPDGRLVERFGAASTPLYLFGAGHVGRSLVLALAPLPFAVIWVDPRPGAIPEQVPSNVTCFTDNDPIRFIDRAPAGAFIAVMTHSHALDLDIVIAALKANRFPYVGLIGSSTKRARFVAAMNKMGIAAEAIGRLVCPIGVTEIRDKAPAAIAAATAAQLLIRRDALAREQNAPRDLSRPDDAAHA